MQVMQLPVAGHPVHRVDDDRSRTIEGHVLVDLNATWSSKAKDHALVDINATLSSKAKLKSSQLERDLTLVSSVRNEHGEVLIGIFNHDKSFNKSSTTTRAPSSKAALILVQQHRPAAVPSTTTTTTTTRVPSSKASAWESTNISACIMYRLWEGDEFGMTHHHLRHWVEYMRDRAGVRHITGYCNSRDVQSCSMHLFHAWKHWPEQDYPTAQRTANMDCIASAQGQWLIICDVDEYPFMPGDTAPGFLQRFLHSSRPISQFLLRTLFFGQRGKRVGPNQTLMEAYPYRMPTAEGSGGRTKALFRPDLVADMHQQNNIVHAMVMREGNTFVPDPENELRLNHYWGYRLDKDTSELVLDGSLLQT
jgi:hypothetical protein